MKILLLLLLAVGMAAFIGISIMAFRLMASGSDYFGSPPPPPDFPKH